MTDTAAKIREALLDGKQCYLAVCIYNDLPAERAQKFDEALALLDAKRPSGWTDIEIGELAAMMTGRLDDDWATLRTYLGRECKDVPPRPRPSVPKEMLAEIRLSELYMQQGRKAKSDSEIAFNYGFDVRGDAMKDYDAIAREKQEDDVWRIFSIQYNRNNEPWRFTIAGGINGDGPAYIVGVIEGREFTEEICEAHNAAILRKHDEAEAGGESDLAKCTIQLLLPTDADPFRRESCNIIDHSYSENGITIECPALADEMRPAPTDEKALK